jgi:hypothetical protein
MPSMVNRELNELNMEAAMSLKSDSITWQTWSRKWGDWRTWFPKINGLREPMQRDLRFRVVAVEKPLEKVQKGSLLPR